MPSRKSSKRKPPSSGPDRVEVAGFSPYATRRKGDAFDLEEYERLGRFFGALRHQKGKFAGQSFTLLPWQHEALGSLLAWKRADGRRRFTEAMIEVPRKNGKSTMLAGLLLYLLLADDEKGAEIYCCASSRDQAAIVGDACRDMIRSNADLASMVEVQRNTIRFEGSKLEILSSDAPTKHGRNPSAIVFDELHTFDENGRELHATMASGMGMRTQPLKIAITTAGHNRTSLAYELHTHAEKVRDGIIEDYQFLPVLYGAPVEADWTSPKVWRAANPSLGVTVTEEFLHAECDKAKELPAYSTTFRTLYLNQWVESRKTWISAASWAECSEEGITEDSLAGRDAWLGLDLSSHLDLSSLAVVVPREDDSVAVLSYSWCPSEGIRRRSRTDRVPYDVWAEQGWLTPTTGQVIDHKAIVAKIHAICQRFKVRRIAYDPWSATQMATELADEGLPMGEVRQGYRSLSEPSKKLESLILTRKLRHGGNPLLAWAVSCACVEIDPAGNLKPSKRASTERIDPLAALVTALAGWMYGGGEQTGPSIYEEPGKAIEWV
jgi:phage terminase large subunit-like protein